MRQPPKTLGFASLLTLLAALHGAPSAEAAVVLRGDVMGDGRVDIGDALRLAQCDVSTTTTTIPSGNADEIHWTVTGQTSVTVDWRGSATVIRYGLTSAYGQSVTAQRPSIVPFSSSGPFWEARITGLQENTVYHYSAGGGPDHTFKTPLPRGSAGFTVYAEGDIGSSRSYPAVAPIQALIAGPTSCWRSAV